MRSIRNEIIGTAIAIAIVMVAIPPWSQTAGSGTYYPGVTFSLGYAFIFDAPMFGTIAFDRLALQLLLVAAIATVAIRYEAQLHSFLLSAWSKIRERKKATQDQ